MVSGGTWGHTGQLDGTASLVARTADGYTWAILLNTSNGSAQFWQELHALGWTWIRGATSWPAHDLFAPSQNATRFWASAAGTAQARLAWANGSGTHRLVLLKANSPSRTFPLDGKSYPRGSKLPNGSVVAYNGTESTAAVSGLSAQYTYYARVIEYRQDTTTGSQPAYTLDGNPGEILPPLVMSRQVAVHAADADTSIGGQVAEHLTPRTSYFIRIRRAWRKSVSHFVQL